MLPYRDSRLTYIALGIFFLIVIGYAYYEARGLLFGPSITVSSNITEVREPFIVIRGRADRIVLDAVDKYGRSRRQAIEIVYTPPTTSEATISQTATTTSASSTPTVAE